MPTLLVRADGGDRIGAGHIVRSLALARAWSSDGGSVRLLTAPDGGSLPAYTAAAGIQVEALAARWPDPQDARALADRIVAAAAAGDAPWVVVDGYHFDAGYTGRLREAGARVLVIDDTAHLPRYDADIVLNQNLGAKRFASRYAGCGLTLCGPRYALLRPEFAEKRPARREYAARPVGMLVALGGARWDAALETIISGIALEGSGFHVKLVNASNDPNAAKRLLVAAGSGVKLEVIAGTSDMAGLMAWADLAVTGAGSTMWELMLMGLPAIVVVLAENQRAVAAAAVADEAVAGSIAAAELTARGLAGRISALVADAALRARVGRAGQSLVDGLGALRVVEAMRQAS